MYFIPKFLSLSFPPERSRDYFPVERGCQPYGFLSKILLYVGSLIGHTDRMNNQTFGYDGGCGGVEHSGDEEVSVEHLLFIIIVGDYI